MNNAARIGSFVVSCALAGAVFAQAATPPATAPGAGASSNASISSDFGSLDTNKDGKVSSTEAQSNSELRSAFSSLDADKDTYLTPSELAKWNKMDKAGGASADHGASSSGASSNSVSEPADSSASAAPKSAE